MTIGRFSQDNPGGTGSTSVCHHAELLDNGLNITVKAYVAMMHAKCICTARLGIQLHRIDRLSRPRISNACSLTFMYVHPFNVSL